MHRLLEFLMANDIFMSFKPDVGDNCMIVAFRKTMSSGTPYNRYYRMSNVEINRLNIDILDVLIDFAERFVVEFNDANVEGE